MRLLLCALLLLGATHVAAQPYAYIPNKNSNNVSVINPATNAVVKTIPVGVEPFGIAVSPDGSLVYVTNRDSNNISVIATATDAVVATITTGSYPHGVAFTRDGSTAYVANRSSGNIAVINVGTGMVTGTIALGSQPYSVVATPDGARVFVSHIVGNTVSVIDTASASVIATLPVGATPLQLAMSPDGGRVYLANGYANNVLVFDSTTLALVTTIPLPGRAAGIAISPDGLGAYVTSDSVSRAWKVDLVAGTVGVVVTPSRTWGVSYHPDGQTVYVTNRAANSVSVIDVASNTIIANVGVGTDPAAHGIFIIPGLAAPPPPGGVELDASPSAPLTYASEIIASSTAPATLANPDGDLNLSVPLGYSFPAGEVRYARLECGSGLRFNAGSTALYDGGSNARVGAINGLGSSAIHFSVTANNGAVSAAHRLVVTGQRAITGTKDVDCTYSLYDFPSQAAGGGVAGRVTTVSGPYLRFAPSYALEMNSQGNPVANVESGQPAYSAFVVQPPTSSSELGQLGGFSHGTRLAVTGEPQPLGAAGTPTTLANVLAAGTKLVFEGDFSVADSVFLSNSAGCAHNTQAANSFDATVASFTIGSTAQMARFLCLKANGDPIPASTYTVAIQPVPANPSVYAVSDQGPLALGEVTRNGTQLQAPLVQIPANYQSRLVLTNTGSIPRTYAARIMREVGSSGAPGPAVTGTIPARSMIVLDMADVLGTITTGPPRGAVEVTIAGPNRDIQGLYQIVNSTTGGISNHTMVRPGSN